MMNHRKLEAGVEQKIDCLLCCPLILFDFFVRDQKKKKKKKKKERKRKREKNNNNKKSLPYFAGIRPDFAESGQVFPESG
jgi:hypothetical protein